MVRENSPKERQRQQLERKKQGQRARCDRILIVSEGSKTEPNYFAEMRRDQRLPAANITVLPSELGTEPLQVVKYAKFIFERGNERNGIEPRAFDQVYAVFDRDDHRTFFDALAFAETLKGKLRNDSKRPVQFEAIASIPCFEFWLLLHFEDVRTPLHRDEVIKRLKRHLPGYEKGTATAFAMTRQHLGLALQRSEKLASRCNDHVVPNPFTAIGALVKALMTLRG